MIARLRKEMQDRLQAIEAELADVEPLIAEKARIEHALATSPFVDYTEGDGTGAGSVRESTPTSG